MIACAKFTPNSTSARICQWFIADGSCAYPGEFACSEFADSGRPPQANRAVVAASYGQEVENRETETGRKAVWLKGVTVFRETEKALLVGASDKGKEYAVWIPKSQVVSSQLTHDRYGVQTGDIELTLWIAKEKGFV